MRITWESMCRPCRWSVRSAHASITAVRMQLPLELGFALSIHKAQVLVKHTSLQHILPMCPGVLDGVTFEASIVVLAGVAVDVMVSGRG